MSEFVIFAAFGLLIIAATAFRLWYGFDEMPEAAYADTWWMNLPM
ncbi:MAG TPA: hypothetical protein PLO33_04315 [Kouleothrix sp.]|jgi:hypothetical protein|nr:hypothetical protein [Kouleothrix sp.]HRC74877.1 hypothetical protein [Kouleothrix sp.]